MHTVSGARLKSEATLDDLRAPSTEHRVPGDLSAVIRGKALIFWDLKVPGKRKKLDAIDTDQITPAADCVSETLETLDERWKAGSFRYLMPDFRARVHRGETFLVAGDRFAIGSSREMSPAGLKGVAEEAGRQMVVVCGNNMGDIFRRNALNLGLEVVQSPEAVADARDGDEMSFDPSTRTLTNETQGTVYEPVPLTPKEEDIRQSGGIFAIGRREFRSSVETAPRIEWPEPDRRIASTRMPSSGRERRCASMPISCPHPTAPRRLRFTRSTRSRAARRSTRGRRRSPTITSSSPAGTTMTSRRRSAARLRARTASRSLTTRRRATASFISTFPSRA
jgi:3-isopropylmalate/(R)-2-methylmalate dehydratase small subunit